jgi:hypothetical protein
MPLKRAGVEAGHLADPPAISKLTEVRTGEHTGWDTRSPAAIRNGKAHGCSGTEVFS